MSNANAEKKRISDSQKSLIRKAAMIVLAVLIIGAVLLSTFSIRNENLRHKVISDYSGGIEMRGMFPIEMDTEAQKNAVKKTKRHGQTGKFDYYCTPTMRMQAYSADSAILFGNVSSNDCALVFTLFDENDVPLYRSKGITPGNYIHGIRLSEPKENGTYACKVYVAAYDLQTNAYIGAQYSDLTLVIGG